MHRAATLVAVVVAGLTTLAIQVLVPRLLLPTFGSGTEVTATVVAASLAGLAVGYAVGGRSARPAWVVAAAVAGTGIHLLVVTAADLAPRFPNDGFVSLLVAALVLNGIPSLLLGLVSPAAVRAIGATDPDRPAAVPGLVFGVGTAANVVGGLAAGFVLVPWVGLSRSLTALGLALVAAGVAQAVASVTLDRGGRPGQARADASAGTAPRPDPSSDAGVSGEGDGVQGGVPGGVEGPPMWGLLALAFYSGVASLAIEVGATRMMASVFGPTTGLWASILSVGLGGLAVGYILGGRVQAAHLRRLLPWVVVANCAWLLLATWFISILRPSAGPPLTASLIIAAMAFGIPFVLFGIESQILVGLAGLRGRNVAAATGTVFAVSTVGGILGALTGTLYLLPALGIGTFVRLSAAGYLLVLLVGFGLWRHRVVPWALAIALVVPFPSFRWRDVDGTLLAQTEGRYQTIRIYTDELTYIRFHLGPTFESEVDANTLEPRFSYARRLLELTGDVSGQRALVIGGAGHALARALETRGAVVTEVELDPRVSELSDEHFGPIAGEVVNTDGRLYVADAEADSFDLVIVDAFSGPQVVPSHLTTREFFEDLRRILAPDGALYMNVIGSTSGSRSRAYDAISSTVADVFPHATRSGESGNILLIAGDEPIHDFTPLAVTRSPLTDDLNPIEVLLERSR